MNPLLEVRQLTIQFPENGTLRSVVDGISFQVEPGEIVGIVGESGSGKSMTALATMGLLSAEAQVSGGSIVFEGRETLGLNLQQRSELRGAEMSMIFQEPMTSLNPVMKIGKQVSESLRLHTKLNPQEIHSRVIEALHDVGLQDAEKICGQYPHELSGGMRQRVMIAQAMICRPKLLIADEPTTALDVVVQAQILRLLKALHQKYQVSVLFISHDLNVIKEICDRVLVMYQGQIVEQGPVQEVLERPQHEYTKTLVSAVPDNQTRLEKRQSALDIKNLNVYYQEAGAGLFKKKHRQHVLRDINLQVYEGELIGIVGESGCGKSTLAKTIVGLNRDYTGELGLMQGTRPQMVFQDPFGSLNPARTIGWTLEEPLRLRGIRSKSERKKQVTEMLRDIGLSEAHYDRYPHELSGGQRQRVSIGATLLTNSRLLVADEPVSALDVTVQSQILSLLLEIHQKRQLTILFISHDLNIVRHICHRVAVIYLGEIVELADAAGIYAKPLHPYTQLLFESGVTDQKQKRAKEWEERTGLPEYATEHGCAFYDRCPYRTERCQTENPPLQQAEEGHQVKCWRR